MFSVALDVDVSGHGDEADGLVTAKRCKRPLAYTTDELDSGNTIVGYKDAVDGRVAADALHKAVYLLAQA